ncbi:hypothetical protein RUM44_001078 [Polyplax serrata]|uniref:rRNA adenine N(6)-methyltransferase n=1 Tax=Polyplax serrata TaxID=468196 RepID=A0ABR1B9J4_POLSC
MSVRILNNLYVRNVLARFSNVTYTRDIQIRSVAQTPKVTNGTPRSTSNSKNRFDLIDKLRLSEVYQSLGTVALMRMKYYLRRKRNNNTIYSFMGDLSVAEKIVNYLKKEIKSKEIVEINPGLGLVTHFLSKEKFQNLIITEDKKFSINTFNYIMNQEQINLEIKYSNVLEANGKSKEILKNLITESDTDFTKSNGKFYFYSNVNFLFSYEVIEEFPELVILPFAQEKFEREKVYFIKLKGKKDCWKLIDQNDYLLYTNFIRVIDRKRRTLIIECLEKWIPDCGPNLIANGISCFTQLRDITADDSVKLFDICTKCEGFKIFQAMQTVMDIQAPIRVRKSQGQ